MSILNKYGRSTLIEFSSLSGRYMLVPLLFWTLALYNGFSQGNRDLVLDDYWMSSVNFQAIKNWIASKPAACKICQFILQTIVWIQLYHKNLQIVLEHTFRIDNLKKRKTQKLNEETWSEFDHVIFSNLPIFYVYFIDVN